MHDLDETHDPDRRSWIESANIAGADFPIQNLPLGRFRQDGLDLRVGVGLGDHIVDLDALRLRGLLAGVPGCDEPFGPDGLTALAQGPAEVGRALRRRLSDLFSAQNAADRESLGASLVAARDVSMALPMTVAAFTDFSASWEHFTRMLALGGQPVRPGWIHLPASYNGRASSVVESGVPVTRPQGLFAGPDPTREPVFGPEPMLDFELEIGAWLRGGNALGQPMSVAQASEAIFGLCLVNDWSARAIQFFEMVLGPHLGKSFHTTVSPWVVTTEALKPFRTAARPRAAEQPSVPAHLFDPVDQATGAYTIAASASLLTADGDQTHLAGTRFDRMYWTLAQLVAHQSSSGAPIQAGDLIGSGTVSDDGEEGRACLAELTERASRAIRLQGGAERLWLEDGDTIRLAARASRPGFVAIGFGECMATVCGSREGHA